jgi:PAS domain S-box-containing protein
MASSDQYRNIFYYNPLPSWIYDLKTFRILDVNQSAMLHYGYSREEFLALTIKDIRPKESIPEMLAAHAEIDRSEGNIYFGVFTHQKKNGEHIRMEVNGHKMDFDGQNCMLVTCQDVTQKERQLEHQKEAELRLNQLNDELRISEERFRFAQELSPDGFTILHPVRNDRGEVVDFTWVYENRAIALIDGTDPDEVIGKSLLEKFPSHRGTEVFEAYVHVASTGSTKTFEDVYMGEILSVPTWLRLVIVSMGDDIAIHTQNITERKLAEDATHKSEATFRSIFEIASLGIAQVDPSNGRILLINGYYESITGYSVDELQNMSFLELTHPDDREKDWEIFSRAARGEEEYRNEKRYIKKDGTVIWVRIHLAFIRDANGKATRTVAICEDITERKEAELRLQNLSDHLPGAVFQYVLFPDGTDALRSVSKGAHHVWGYSPEMVENDINLVWHQTKTGGDFEQVRQSVIEAAATKTVWLSRYRSVLPNGEVQIHLGSGTPNYLADGTVVFNSLVLDVTKQVENEELLAQTTHMARIGSWEVNLVNNNIVWSDMVHQLHETDPTSFVPDLDTMVEFNRHDYRDKVRTCFRDCMEKGKPFDVDVVLVSAKKNERWVRIIGKADMIDGQCKRIYGSFQDIHVHKSNEIALEQSLKKLQDYQYAIDQSASFTITDTEGIIRDVNDHFCTLSQYSREELIGNTHRIINSNYHPKEFFADFWNTITSGNIWRGEVRNRKKDGSFYWADTTVVPFVDDNNIPFQFLAFRIDITERKLAQEKLTELNKSLKRYTKELERSNEELEQFAYVSSHDLQEPLRMISSFMDQLVRKYGDKLDDRALQYIHFATDGAKRMKQIILDLLLFSSANKTVDQAEKVDLNEIVAEYNLLRRRLIADKNATIIFENLPTLETYKAPITQIFHCLLDNALKYAKEEVPVRIEIICTEKETEWEFTVKDNGIGIEEAFFDKIFVIFQRLHNRDQHEGTGVGLSIAKRCVEFLGGRIWVASQLDVGSTFYFTIAKNEWPTHG